MASPYGGSWAGAYQGPSMAYGGAMQGGAQPYGGPNYYDPSSLYGARESAVTMPIVSGPNQFLANQPQAGYARYTAPFASGEDPFSRFVRSQYGQAQQGYQAALATNPSLSFYNNYLPGLGGENYFRQRFLSLPASARGEQPGLLGGGRMRWFLNR